MEKGKSLFKNKKILLGIIGIILLIEVIIFVFILGLNKNDNKADKLAVKQNLIEEKYVMYVKINPLVKLTFKESYYECENENGEKEVCSSRENEVTGYELLNDDAKEVYQAIDFKGKNILDSLAILCDKAKDKDIEIKSLKLTSDWEDIPDKTEIKKQLTEESKYSVDYEIVIDYQKSVDVQEILNNELLDNPEIKTYMVKFETDGGNRITGKVVEENTPVDEPNNPTKTGYTFVEWQLNGKKFDFDQEITKDITLIAKWKKEESKTEEKPNKNEDSKPDNNNDNQNTIKPSESNKNDDNKVPNENPTEKEVIYPNFLKENYTLEEVEKFANENNIYLSYSEEETDAYTPGTIFYQSRKAGSTVVSETTLRIKVAKALKVNEDPTEEQTITKSFTITNIIMKNLSSEYTAHLLESYSIIIELIGKETLVNNITKDNIQIYVDLENATEGEQTLKINVTGLDSNISYKLSQDEVKLNIKNKNGNVEETNSKEPGQDDTPSSEE